MMSEKVTVVYCEATAQGYCLKELNLWTTIFELGFENKTQGSTKRQYHLQGDILFLVKEHFHYLVNSNKHPY